MFKVRIRLSLAVAFVFLMVLALSLPMSSTAQDVAPEPTALAVCRFRSGTG
jgi:hypothetical protein